MCRSRDARVGRIEPRCLLWLLLVTRVLDAWPWHGESAGRPRLLWGQPQAPVLAGSDPEAPQEEPHGEALRKQNPQGRREEPNHQVKFSLFPFQNLKLGLLSRTFFRMSGGVCVGVRVWGDQAGLRWPEELAPHPAWPWGPGACLPGTPSPLPGTGE